MDLATSKDPATAPDAELEMDADKVNEFGETILHIASQNGNTKHVRFILREFANKDLLIKLNNHMRTALHSAIYGRHTEVAEVLIDAAHHLPPSSFQTFLRQEDRDMDTALHAAVMEGNLAIVKRLVKADPTDTHKQNYDGKTPMYIAVEKGLNDIAEIISTTCDAPSLLGPRCSAVVRIRNLDQTKSPGGSLYKIMDKDALYAAAIAGDGDAIAALEIHADKLNDNEETILHTESGNGETEHVRFILRQFAGKNHLVKVNEFKQTALHLASSQGHTGVAEILINAARHLLPPPHDDNPVTSFQAFLRQADNVMDTALHKAVKKGNEAIVKLLVKADTMFMLNSGNQTVLHLALSEGHTKVAEILINAARHLLPPDNDNLVTSRQAFAFLRQANNNMDTALHVAVKLGDVGLVKLLVETDPSDTHLQNNEGKTPMYIAVEEGLNGIAEAIFTTCIAPSLDGPHGRIVVCIKNLDQAKIPDGSLYKIMDKDALYAAAIARDADAIAALEMQADKLHKYKETILHTESANGKTEHVRFILREFAGKNHLIKLNEYKQTALHLASAQGHTEVAEILINAARHLLPSFPVTSFQAFLIRADIWMDTALHKAVKKGNVALVKLLVDADTTDNQNRTGKTLMFMLNSRKQTVLHLALSEGHTEVAEILINAARVLLPRDNDNLVASYQAFDFLRRADNNKDTALHVAVKKGNKALVKLLVETDPSHPYTPNDEGETPMYIAAEKGYFDVAKILCTTCTAPPNLVVPGGTTTVLHILIKNVDQGKREDRDVITQIIEAVRSRGTGFRKRIKILMKTDENRRIILELAVERNYLDIVKSIIAHLLSFDYIPTHPLLYRNDPGPPQMLSTLMDIKTLTYKALDTECNDMFNVLSEAYEKGVQLFSRNNKRQKEAYLLKVPELISAISHRQEESVISMLKESYAENLLTFADNLGWTALHHATYHEFDIIIDPIVEAQKKFNHPLVYQDMLLTPFHVAAKKGYTSTVICLMESWPSSSSAYTVVVNKTEQNILHLAALESKKEMIQGILKYCLEESKKEFVNKQDSNGDTPLHILTKRGCFIPELLRYEGLDIRVENKQRWTPPDMLYFHEQVIDDQAQIKIILDGLHLSKNIFSNSVLPSKRIRKDKILYEQAKLKMHEKCAAIKEDTDAIANCFAEAIAGDPISKAALQMKADKLNESGETILHVETKKGNVENVRFIMNEFANKSLLGKLDRSKQTALHLAAHHGHAQVVEVLIDAARHLPSSANLDAHNPVSSFHDFIRQGNGPSRNTALHLAVLHDNATIVKLLIKADPNDSHVQNNEGKTPIYIAAENGYVDIIKEICTTCTALSLEGPHGLSTALHALITNIGQVKEGANDMIKMMIDAAKGWSSAENPSLVMFEELFSRTDESGNTLLQLAMERNYVDAVKVILQEDPAYQLGREIKRNGIMRLIYKAIDKKYSRDIIEFLSVAYEAGIDSHHKGVLALILDIKRRDEDSVLGHLKDAKELVTFKEENGWTPLHYAVHHEFDSILGAIIEAQEDVGHQFVYEKMVSTPFHVAVKNGYTSTVIRLMQSWPALTSAVSAANSPYTAINDVDGRNILHMAAAANNKEMVQCILNYCPKEYKEKILKEQDTNRDTPLHLLISHGCFIPELIKHEVLDKVGKNNDNFTPQDMLYYKNDVVADQVHIKMALYDAQTNQSSARNLWPKRTEKKMDIQKSTIPQSKQRMKDVLFDECEKSVMDEEEKHKMKDLEKYKQRTNTQIIVTALIATISFTAGFTMPGGLRQSGEVDEGLVLLSKKKAFNAFIISDALALLLSTSSLFFYFLESVNYDPREVSKLNAASTVLNIISVVAMMLTFMSGTYVVLSHSPAIAITVCGISSIFFLLIIILSIKTVCGGKVKRNED